MNLPGFVVFQFLHGKAGDYKVDKPLIEEGERGKEKKL